MVGAGESRRMGYIDKIVAPLGGIPLLAHCLSSFNESPSVHAISIATSRCNIERVRELVRKLAFEKAKYIVAGGARRQDSTLNALRTLEGSEIVLVHDGARPFVDEEMIEQAVVVARESAAGTAAIPVKDTIKVVNPDMSVRETPSRESLWAAQTPQSFRYDLIIRAHTQIEDDVTDDAAMIEAVGHPVKLFMGSYDNIKVTTPEDLHIAEAILGSRREAKAN
ncbi:MAG: 2-C-methyl-D-erythritol 4-phosphate cytidylyltransferase [Dehalococcoidia bacterium]|nr:2-C-methyl-D-erythritol 4-phosphate cytidylyltransferase [Dehalococcoidia bacterium]